MAETAYWVFSKATQSILYATICSILVENASAIKCSSMNLNSGSPKFLEIEHHSILFVGSAVVCYMIYQIQLHFPPNVSNQFIHRHHALFVCHVAFILAIVSSVDFATHNRAQVSCASYDRY